MMHRSESRCRSGTILILIAGISALLVSLTLSFLVKVQSDFEETAIFNAEIQARIMLTAGLQYVAESSRLGWDDPSTPTHEEAFGWIDTRDGRPGPRDQFGNRLFDGDATTGIGNTYPAVGTAIRCPMQVLCRPPFAIKPTNAYNPVAPDPSKSWAELLSNQQPSPQPATEDWAAFAAGDPRPRTDSVNRAWFRIYRKGPSRFVITCGAGATQGFRNWADVVASNAQTMFPNEDVFNALRQSEVLLWYETEWSSSVGYNVKFNYLVNQRTYELHTIGDPRLNTLSSLSSRQFTGQFLWIERLALEPPQW